MEQQWMGTQNSEREFATEASSQKASLLFILFFSFLLTSVLAGCGEKAPVLKDLVVLGAESNYILLGTPKLDDDRTIIISNSNIDPVIDAYIGIDGIIQVNGKTVTGAISSFSHINYDVTFQYLQADTVYRIIVIASNSKGYSVKQIKQSTSGIAPVLKDLVISSFDDDSISIAKPAFSTSGNPTPTVQAYIGLDGTISLSGKDVSGSIQGPVDVSKSGCTFNGLPTDSHYRIIVVAENQEGYSVKEILQSIKGIAPVLNDISTGSVDFQSITLIKPTLNTAGNPAPSVNAYIGISTEISVSGDKVTGVIKEGPIDVSKADYQFNNLAAGKTYKIIVVAENSEGYSVKQILQATKGVAPVLNELTISSFDSNSIILKMPTFSVAGNPTPKVLAYIGIDGTIGLTSGNQVSGYLQGPIDISMGDYQFNNLNTTAPYKIIVTATNPEGFSYQEIEKQLELPTTLFVKQGASGNGERWDEAADLQNALLKASQTGSAVKEIWVAAGTYKPTSAADANATFHLISGVSIYGGFAGNETALSQRDWDKNKTILSGDIDNNDTAPAAGNPTSGIVGTNSLHVVTGADNAVLDGFIITAGNGDSGGGMLNDGVSPSVKNCTFLRNNANVYAGGGMFCNNKSNAIIFNCEFIENTTQGYNGYGGGLKCNIGNPTISFCSFIGNRANYGGGFACYSNSPNLTQCVFLDNFASWGGGVFINNSNSIITNCLVSANTATNGGGIYTYSSISPSIINCTITGNTASSGRGVYINNSSTPKIFNSIIWNDTITNASSGTPTISYCDIQGGYAGTGNINFDPLFMDAAKGNFSLAKGSPCIDSGSNALVPADILTDILGAPRFIDIPGLGGTDNFTVDIGAYEYQG